MAKKLKMKANKKGTIQQIPQDLEKAHGGTVNMISGIRNAKNRMPKAIRDVFPDF